jgi:hypothetical protein
MESHTYITQYSQSLFGICSDTANSFLRVVSCPSNRTTANSSSAMNNQQKAELERIFGKDYDGMKDPAMWLQGACQAISRLRSELTSHRYWIKFDARISGKSCKKRLEYLETVRIDLRAVQIEALEALKRIEVWKCDAHDIGFGADTW